jgi:hypothetical protein
LHRFSAKEGGNLGSFASVYDAQIIPIPEEEKKTEERSSIAIVIDLDSDRSL